MLEYFSPIVLVKCNIQVRSTTPLEHKNGECEEGRIHASDTDRDIEIKSKVETTIMPMGYRRQE